MGNHNQPIGVFDSGVGGLSVFRRIRANLPQFANWKTFPQLFVHGELIGGSDIVADLETSGELKRIVDEARAQAGAV